MNKVEEYLKKIDFSPYGDVKITAFELRQIMTGFEKHLASNTEIIGNVSLSCYLFKVDNEDCFVLGENIADAIDRLEKEEPNAEYELVHSKTLDCIY